MRAIIYARYSSENQRDASVEDQVRLCKERIDREGWLLFATYADRAISGTSLMRPGYQKLLHDVRAGHVEVVVAEALDRISRDQEHVAGFFKQLNFVGVKLLTISEGEISELHVGLKGTMNALFLKDLAAKTHRGLRGRVEAGRSGGGVSFGYDVVKELDARGEPIRGGRRINVREASIVLRIFRAYAAGQSPRRIAIDLNAEGVRGPNSAEWGPSTLNGNVARGTGILNNELYTGRLVWNRLRYSKDPSTEKRVSKLNEASDWVIQEVPDLRIVSETLWNSVKARQLNVKRASHDKQSPDKPFWDRRRPRFLLSGLAKCGVCESSYVKVNAKLFGCAAAHSRGTCTNHKHIRIEKLEASVLEGLKHRLMDPDLFKVFCDEFQREFNKAQFERSAGLATKNTELEKVNRRIQRIVELITEDDAPAKALKDELRKLEIQQGTLQRTLADFEAPRPLLHPNLAEVYRRKVADLGTALSDPELRDEAFEQIRSLIDKLVLSPRGDELELEIHGELAKILHLCGTGSIKDKPGAVADAGDVSRYIKMVAGAGFEPTTFRL